MKCATGLCILWLLLIGNAYAAQTEEYALNDPLARRIVCTGSHEAKGFGPGYARVSIFSVPEPSGAGERLYVGFVEDLWDSRSPSQLWSGPVAAGWRNLRPVPGHKSSIAVRNPKRYRVDRLTTLPGGGVKTDTMEIDLETNPAQLRREGTDQQRYLDAQPLGECLFMNDSLKLIVRLWAQQSFQSDTLLLRSYEMHLGEGAPPVDRLKPRFEWNAKMEPHLLAICRKDAPDQALLSFLPVRPYGWLTEKLLASPAKGDMNGSFVLQMLAEYLDPLDDGELMARAARYRVSVGLRGLSITTMERGLEYNSRNESWERPKTRR